MVSLQINVRCRRDQAAPSVFWYDSSGSYEEEGEDFAEGVFGAEEEWHDEDDTGGGGQTLQEEEETNQAEAYLVEQFGSMEEAENFVDEAYGSASRTFDEARKLVNEVKKARGYFPIVGVGCYDDGFNSLPGNRARPTSFSRTWYVARTKRRKAPRVQ